MRSGVRTPYHSAYVLSGLTSGARPDSRPVADSLEMVRRQERRGNLLAAYHIVNRGLEQHPEDVDLAYRAVLALARTGSTTEAERRFVELDLTEVDTESRRPVGDHSRTGPSPPRATSRAPWRKPRPSPTSGSPTRTVPTSRRSTPQRCSWSPATGHGEGAGLGGTFAGGIVRGGELLRRGHPGRGCIALG